MTQQKSKKVKDPSHIKKGTPKIMPDLRKNFLSLSQDDQQAVTNFFNAHNIAVFLFSKMSPEAQEYTNYCISLSQEANKVEEKHE